MCGDATMFSFYDITFLVVNILCQSNILSPLPIVDRAVARSMINVYKKRHWIYNEIDLKWRNLLLGAMIPYIYYRHPLFSFTFDVLRCVMLNAYWLYPLRFNFPINHD